MCGPLVLALPDKSTNRKALILSRTTYHISRSIAYSLMGFTLGFIGFGFTLIGIQQYVSLVAGIIMLSLVLIPAKKRSSFLHASYIKLPDLMKSTMQRLMKSDSYGAMMSLGFLNGWLPCGFVYMALTGAVGLGNPSGSALFMLLFGLGTLPVMLAVSVLPGIQSLRIKKKLNDLFPYITTAIAYC